METIELAIALQEIDIDSFFLTLRGLDSFNTGHKQKDLETVNGLRLRRFLGLFWPIFDSNFGGNIQSLIFPPKFESKIGSKELKNRQKLNPLTVS